MISSIFDKLHDFWLPYSTDSLDQTLKALPENTDDLKIVEVLKKKEFVLVDGDSYSETVTLKNKIYLMNVKTNHLYRPFSESDLKKIKILEVEGVELAKEEKFSGFSFSAEKELGTICAKVFFSNYAELLFKTIYIGYIFFRDSFFELKDKEIKLAAPSIIFGAFGALSDVAREIFYSIGIQIAACEGLFFDPVRGFFKIEQLERLAARGIDKKDDPCYQATKKGFDLFQPKATERCVLSWYNQIKLIHGSNLNDKVVSAKQAKEDKFELISQKNVSVSETPEIFPFVPYAEFELRKLAAYVHEVLIKEKLGSLYDYASSQCRMVFESRFAQTLPG